MKINGVFEGGGVKAIALAGAVRAMEEQGIKFHRVAGTSSGAIVAAFIAAGYSSEEMKKLIMENPFPTFLQRSWIHRIYPFGSVLRLLIKKGLYSGEALERWIRLRLKEKGIRTFGDIPPRGLRVIASDITTGKILVLPDDIARYGGDPNRLDVARAVRMSASLPYFFDPVLLLEQSGRKRTFQQRFVYIVDGGILSNFPLWIFDKELEENNQIPTIGFRLVGKKEGEPKKIFGPITFFQALFSTMMEAHDEKYIEEHQEFRTVKIPTMGIRTTQFDLTPEMGEKLFESGYKASVKFLNRWSLSVYMEKFNKYCV